MSCKLCCGSEKEVVKAAIKDLLTNPGLLDEDDLISLRQVVMVAELIVQHDKKKRDDGHRSETEE